MGVSRLTRGASSTTVLRAGTIDLRDAPGNLYIHDGSTPGGKLFNDQSYKWVWSEQEERILAGKSIIGVVQIDGEWGGVYRHVTANLVWVGVSGRVVELATPNSSTNTPLRVFQVRMTTGALRYIALTRTLTEHSAEWSDDPRTGWTRSLLFSTSTPTQDQWISALADCGSGRVIWPVYHSVSTQPPLLYYSPDGGASWGANAGTWNDGNPLLRLTPRSSSGPTFHWHGVVYDAKFDKGYFMLGDQLNEVGILICDDLWGTNGLVNNPGLWRARWALEVVTKLTLPGALGTDFVVGNSVSDNNTKAEWTGIIRKVDTTTKEIWVGLDYPFAYASVVTASGIYNATTTATSTVSSKTAVTRGDWSNEMCAGWFVSDHENQRAASKFGRTLHLQLLNDDCAYWLTDDSVAVGSAAAGTKLCRFNRLTHAFEHLGTYPGLSYGGCVVDQNVALLATSSYAAGGVYSFSSTNTIRLIAVESGGKHYEVAQWQRVDDVVDAYPNQEITLEPRNIAGRIVCYNSGTTPGWLISTGEQNRYTVSPVGRLVPTSGFSNAIPASVAPTQYWEGGECPDAAPSATQVQSTYASAGLITGGTHINNIHEVKAGRAAWRLEPNLVTHQVYLSYLLAHGTAKAIATRGTPLTATVWIWLPATAPEHGQDVSIQFVPNNGGTGSFQPNATFAIPTHWWNGGWHHVMLHSYRTKLGDGDLRCIIWLNSSSTGRVPAEYKTIWVADMSIVNGSVELPERD